jgi:excisionase family DNA binding protein
VTKPTRGRSAATRRSGDDDLTLQQAADILGVHYMTAYRYVRTGRLAATQIGTAWHVRRSSLDALVAPARAGRAKAGATANRGRYARRLSDRLVAGDDAEAWHVSQEALASACSPEDLYLDVLGPALRRVGDEWAARRVSVAQEHRATAGMYRLVGRLGPLLTRRGRTRGSVVLGALENDFHGLATALVADVLRGRGFSVVDLGANTPSRSFVEAISAANRLRATGIVVSTPIKDAEIRAAIAAIKSSSGAPLLLGGLAIRDATHAHRLGADAWTNSARDAVEWFETTAPH